MHKVVYFLTTIWHRPF